MNILIAVDGSEFSDVAVQEVIQSQARTAHIRLINVVEPLPVVESWAYAVDWQQLLEINAKRRNRSWRQPRSGCATRVSPT